MADQADITVITINRNTGGGARLTAESVREQTHPCSWVVVDGASSDGSQHELRQAQRAGDVFLSEPDAGIADAFNKGIALSRGRALVFLNAGDCFSGPTALEQLANVWRGTGRPWITGGAEVLAEDGRPLYRRCHPASAAIRDLVGSGCRIWHAATLVDMSLFERHGRFDTTFRISMDYEMWLRFAAAGNSPHILPVPICRFRLGGISSRVGARLAEDRRARRMHGFTNPPLTEWRLGAIATAKRWMAPLAWPCMYRIKERLRL
jgi:glycosyltransferase involved in cell wall biosynthesis